MDRCALPTIDLGRVAWFAVLACSGCRFDTEPAFSGDPPQTVLSDGSGDAGQLTPGFGNPAMLPGASTGTGHDVPLGKAPDAESPPVVIAPPDASLPVPVDAGEAHAGDPPAADAELPIPDAEVPKPDAAEPMPAAPGTLYSACTDLSDCDEGLVCSSVLGDTRAYCTASCVANQQGSVVCPQPASGTVQATCEFGTGLCELSDCEDAECPVGMECVDNVVDTGQGSGIDYHDYECRY